MAGILAVSGSMMQHVHLVYYVEQSTKTMHANRSIL